MVSLRFDDECLFYDSQKHHEDEDYGPFSCNPGGKLPISRAVTTVWRSGRGFFSVYTGAKVVPEAGTHSLRHGRIVIGCKRRKLLFVVPV